MLNPLAMTDRPVMVTGASSGIGRETAILLAELGARVVAVGRDRGRLEETLVRMPGGDHLVEVFDLTCGDEILAWYRGVVQKTGPLRGLAHCAGIQSHQPLRVITTAALEKLYRANTVSSALLARAFQQRGSFVAPASIVFVASTAANLAAPANAGYGATKAAILSLTRSFAMELFSQGIRVNAVVPALVDTEMARNMLESSTPELFDALVRKHPLGLGQPRDIAHAIAFLLADTARWITGSSLVVDGGLSAQ